MLALGWDPPCSDGRKPPPPGAGIGKAALTLSLKARPRGGREGQQSGGLQRQVPHPRPPSACRWEAWGGGELQTPSRCGPGAGLALGERLLHPGVREL